MRLLQRQFVFTCQLLLKHAGMHSYAAHGDADIRQEQEAGVGTPATPSQLWQRSMQAALASPLWQAAAHADSPAGLQTAFAAELQPSSAICSSLGPADRPASPASSLLEELLCMERLWGGQRQPQQAPALQLPMLRPPRSPEEVSIFGGSSFARRPASPTSSLLEELLCMEGELTAQQQPQPAQALQMPAQLPPRPSEEVQQLGLQPTTVYSLFSSGYLLPPPPPLPLPC